MSGVIVLWAEFSQRWAALMLPWSLQALVLIAAAAGAARIDRARPAAARHFLWLAVTVAVALLPVLAAVMPSIPTPLRFHFNAPLATVPEPSITPAITPLDSRPSAAGAAGPQAMATGSAIASVLCAVWGIGVFGVAIRVIGSQWTWRRMRRTSRRIANDTLPLPIGYSPHIPAPVLVGLVHPMILLPEGLEQGVTDEERQAIVLHELAHYRRRDHVTARFQAALGAVFFFHPAVRYALHCLSLERELACDEAALRAGVRPSVYAEALLKVAERASGGAPINVAFHTSGKILARRLDMILKASAHPASPQRFRFFALSRAVAIFLFVILLLPQPGRISAQPAPVLSPAARTGEGPSMLEAPEVVASRAVIVAPAVVAAPSRQDPPQSAPIPTSRVTGTVSDATGAVLPGVRVTLVGTEVSLIAVSLSALSNEIGQFVFPEVPPGKISLQWEFPGFDRTVQLMEIQAGVDSTVNMTLRVGSVSQAVNVQASRSLQPAASAAPRGTPIRIGGDYVAPKLVSAPKPVYPADARDARIEGTILLHAMIATDGQVTAITPIRGQAELVNAAMEAVAQWRYSPGFLNGRPIEVHTTVAVSFSLTD